MSQPSKGAFIWADLSTYNTQSSIDFYKAVFGWELNNMQEYHLASISDIPIAGIFETPAFLQKINMPHFWMSYFQVDSTPQVVELAKSLGAKIEVDSTDFNNGKIALIRDPQGAGFTVYEGEGLNFAAPGQSAVLQTELHVSDLDNVIPFYTALFNWQLKAIDSNTYQVQNDVADRNILLKQIPNDLKGKYEYWAISFQVNNLSQSASLIEKHGGSVITKEGSRILMSDNSQEAFFYIQEA